MTSCDIHVITLPPSSSLAMTSCDIRVILFTVPNHMVIVDYLKMCHDTVNTKTNLIVLNSDLYISIVLLLFAL